MQGMLLVEVSTLNFTHEFQLQGIIIIYVSQGLNLFTLIQFSIR